MSRRLKDFFEIFFFGFVLSTIIVVLGQLILNLAYFVIDGFPLSFNVNIRIFIAFEILFSIIFASFGLIYIFWFVKYKTLEDGTQRKTRRYL